MPGCWGVGPAESAAVVVTVVSAGPDVEELEIGRGQREINNNQGRS